jgi:hypothetical protein
MRRWRMTWYLRTLGFAARAPLSAVRVVARFARTANPPLAAARRDVEEPLVSTSVTAKAAVYWRERACRRR